MLDIRTIARVLGGEVTGRDKCLVPGPNHSRRDRSLSIRVRADGFDVYSFTGDDWHDCRDYVRSKLGWADEWKRNDNKPDMTGDDDERRKKLAIKLWNDGIDPRGTLVEAYLREHRGLTLPDEICNSVIRFHRGLYYKHEDHVYYLPGMLCLMRDVKTNTPTGVHRTFLGRYDGRKIDRRMLGLAKGAAIKFDADLLSGTLTVGEGVETVLAAREYGFKPAWALGSAGAFASFPILRKVREIRLLLENDPTNEKFARVCCDRYRDAGRKVHVVRSNVGSDFNDAWRAMRHG